MCRCKDRFAMVMGAMHVCLSKHCNRESSALQRGPPPHSDVSIARLLCDSQRCMDAAAEAEYTYRPFSPYSITPQAQLEVLKGSVM